MAHPAPRHRIVTPRLALPRLIFPLLAGFVLACEPGPQPSAQPLAIVGGTLIDGTGSPPVPDATVVIEGDIIVCAGPSDSCAAPEQAQVIGAAGRWVTPGLIDAHVHFSQSGWIDARPETAGRPVDQAYESAIDELRRHPERAFRALLCSGVTAVADVGGYTWTLELPARVESEPEAPRVSVAGPLLTFIRYPLVYDGESQMVTLSDSAGVVSAVGRLAELEPDFIKLWYIVDPSRGVDSTTARELAELTAEEVHSRGLRFLVHATGLWEARHAVEIGADVLVHSVFNDPLDREFLELAQQSGVIYTPTIAVLEGYAYMSLGVFARDRYDLRCADRGVLASWEDWALKSGQAVMGRALEAGLEPLRERQAVTLANLRRVHGAGIPVAMGTDSGNPMTLHGSAVVWELKLMEKAGLTRMDVIVAATLNSARVVGRADELGTIEPGKLADLLVLSSNPLEDLSAFNDIAWVIRGGVAHAGEDLLPEAIS